MFISVIVQPNDVFWHPIGNIDVEHDGYVIRQGILPPAGSARTKTMYSRGCYRFIFEVEKAETISRRKWIFFGIISAHAPEETQSYKAPSVHGWAGSNKIYCNGIKSHHLDGYTSDIEKKDMIELLLDCDQRVIQLTNQRTNSKHELQIDVRACPLPWQPLICLYYAGDRVRILRP